MLKTHAFVQLQEENNTHLYFNGLESKLYSLKFGNFLNNTYPLMHVCFHLVYVTIYITYITTIKFVHFESCT